MELSVSIFYIKYGNYLLIYYSLSQFSKNLSNEQMVRSPNIINECLRTYKKGDIFVT